MRRAPEDTGTLRVGEVELDLDGVVVRVDGVRTPLTYREFLVLRVLMEQAGRVVDRETLRRSVWGADGMPRARVVDVYVRRVRARLGDGGVGDGDGDRLERHIRTVRGEGYVFVGPGDDPPVRVPPPRAAD